MSNAITPFHFTPGKMPLLVSIPHAGTQLMPEVESGLSEAARGLPDTDWHIPLLYDFVRDLGASVLIGRYSRFVVDLNRSPDNQPLYTTATTGLFPETLFDGTPTFADGKTPSAAHANTISITSGSLIISRFSKNWLGSKPRTAMPCCLMRTPLPA